MRSPGVYPLTNWRMVEGVFPSELAGQARCEHLQPITLEGNRTSQRYLKTSTYSPISFPKRNLYNLSFQLPNQPQVFTPLLYDDLPLNQP